MSDIDEKINKLKGEIGQSQTGNDTIQKPDPVEDKKPAETAGPVIPPKLTARQMEEISKQRIRDKKKEYAEMNKKRIRVKFTNIESPGVDVNFNYQGFEYWLHDGEEYNLPTYVVDHLNRLATPKYESVINKSGVPEHKMVGSFNRFSVVPLNMGELTK